MICTDQSPWFGTHVIRRLSVKFNHHRVKAYHFHPFCIAKVESRLTHRFLHLLSRTLKRTHRDRETERDRERDRDRERQRDRETEKQRETERQREARFRECLSDNASMDGLGDMAQKIITIIILISVDIDNYHDKCQIFISFKFKARFFCFKVKADH